MKLMHSVGIMFGCGWLPPASPIALGFMFVMFGATPDVGTV